MARFTPAPMPTRDGLANAPWETERGPGPRFSSSSRTRIRVHRSFSEDLARRRLHTAFVQVVRYGHYTLVAGRARFGDEARQSPHSAVEVAVPEGRVSVSAGHRE